MTKDDEVMFDRTVAKLRKWVIANTEPRIATSVLGAVLSQIIWESNPTNDAANTEAEDIATRIKRHVMTLNRGTLETIQKTMHARPESTTRRNRNIGSARR